jgi:flagellin
MRASGPRLALGTVTIDNRDVARRAISVVHQALDQVTEVRTRVGAFQNRLDKVAATAASAIEDMVNTQSAIGDTDMARAIGNLTRSQILAEAAASMGRQSGGDVERLLGLLR